MNKITQYYLSAKQERSLKEKLLKDKDSLFRVGTIIYGSSAWEEWGTIKDTYLENLFLENPDEFKKLYTIFNFHGSEARTEISTLLNTYRVACPWFTIEKKDITERLSASYSGEEFLYPFGKIIDIKILPESHFNLKSLLIRKPSTIGFYFTLYIDKITQITGNIESHFEVITSKQKIRFDYLTGIWFL